MLAYDLHTIFLHIEFDQREFAFSSTYLYTGKRKIFLKQNQNFYTNSRKNGNFIYHNPY